MPQLHLYVPKKVAALVRRKAEARGQTVSGYLAHLVRKEIDTGWPRRFFEEVVGRWKGDPLRRPRPGRFERRDGL